MINILSHYLFQALLKTDSVDNDNGSVTYATNNAHVYLSGGYNFDFK